jgi:hypothetical protein
MLRHHPEEQGDSVAGVGGDNPRAKARVPGDRSTRARGTASRNRVRLASPAKGWQREIVPQTGAGATSYRGLLT